MRLTARASANKVKAHGVPDDYSTHLHLCATGELKAFRPATPFSATYSGAATEATPSGWEESVDLTGEPRIIQSPYLPGSKALLLPAALLLLIYYPPACGASSSPSRR